MKTYYVYGVVSGGKFLGEVEAESKEEAERMGYELDACYVSLCHQCAAEVEDAEVVEISAEEKVES